MVVASILTDVTDWLDRVSGNEWFLLVILGIALLDSVVPIVPSETAVIMGGVAAGGGNQNLVLVILCAAAGAFLGDHLAYLLGRSFSARINAWAFDRPTTKDRMEWASRQIRKRGGMLLVTARFIPGGRTVLTVSSGLTRQPFRWFALWIAVAAVVWATYAATLGYVFGSAFADNHTVAFVTAFAAALALTGIVELVRHIRERRRDDERTSVADQVGSKS
jgi:membrane-associated protein